MPRLSMPDQLTPEQLYAEWVRYLEAAFKDIIHAFWNRKVFRAMGEMFDKNPQLRDGEGGPTAWAWVAEMYSNYVVMLVRRELDSQAQVLTLTRMLYDMEKNHGVLVAHAKGTVVPTVDEVRADREALQAGTEKVVAYGNRIIAHRTPPGGPDVTWAELDDALRALRKTLIKYNGVLKASDLAYTTPTPQFDWLEPYRVAWIPEGFEEPDAEEAAPLSEAERRAVREHRQKWGFDP
jgi:hypothetical protein